MSKKIPPTSQDFDFSLVTISSPLRDYTLAHFMNQVLLLDLEKVKDLEVFDHKTNTQLFFSNFSVSDLEEDRGIHLIKNRGLGGYFFPSLKQFDYILLWVTSISSEEVKKYLQRINTIPEVIGISKINTPPSKELDRMYWLIP